MWYLTIHLLTARCGHSLTSTSRRVDCEPNRLAAESGCKGGKEGGTGPGVGQTVQARLPPIPRAKPLTSLTGPTSTSQVQVELKKGETIMIDAALHLPAAFLHEAFSNRSGFPPDHFELYYRGKQLEGEAALSSWGIGKDSTIEVKMRGRGGAPGMSPNGGRLGPRRPAAGGGGGTDGAGGSGGGGGVGCAGGGRSAEAWTAGIVQLHRVVQACIGVQLLE